MYTIKFTARFNQDVERCRRKGLNLNTLWSVVELLVEEGQLPDSFKPHMLSDEYAGCWECHVDNDWLLVWRQNNNKLTLLLTNTGTHDELFHKKEVR